MEGQLGSVLKTRRFQRYRQRIGTAAFAAVSALACASCDVQPGIFRAEEKAYLVDYCGTKILIPAAYTTEIINTEGIGPPNFLMASWPSMNGWQTPAASDERQGSRSRISIFLGFGGDCRGRYSDRIEKRFLEFKDGTAPLGRERPPAEQLPDFKGFKHFVRPHSEREMVTDAFSETDIFIRRSATGEAEAALVCPGEPIKPKRYPQCKMWLRHPDNASFRIEVSFDRNRRFDDFPTIEELVINKLREFESAAAEKAISDQ